MHQAHQIQHPVVIPILSRRNRRVPQCLRELLRRRAIRSRQPRHRIRPHQPSRMILVRQPRRCAHIFPVQRIHRPILVDPLRREEFLYAITQLPAPPAPCATTTNRPTSCSPSATRHIQTRPTAETDSHAASHRSSHNSAPAPSADSSSSQKKRGSSPRPLPRTRDPPPVPTATTIRKTPADDTTDR